MADTLLVQVIAEIMALHLHRAVVLGMMVELRTVSSIVALAQTLAAMAVACGFSIQTDDALCMVNVLTISIFPTVVLRCVAMTRVVLLSIHRCHRGLRKASNRDIVTSAPSSLALRLLLMPNVLWRSASWWQACFVALQDHGGSLMRALLMRDLKS